MLNTFSSFPSRQRVQNRSGWTLVELMIAMALGLIVMGSVLATAIYVSKSFVIIGNYHDLDKDSRRTLDLLSRDIRSISNVMLFTSNEIKMVDVAGNQVDYKWDGSNGFVRTCNGAAQVMLKNCDYLSMSNYQRNAAGNFAFVPASSLNQTKLIDLRWHCWRSILGSHLTTESVQTAKIVVRNF